VLRILVVLGVAAAFVAAGCTGEEETATRTAQTSTAGSTTTSARVSPPSDFVATYSYEIEARADKAVSQRVPVSVEVPVPPLRAARLQGDFSVKVRTLSKSGYGEYVVPTFGWSFRPRCGEGACDVLWRDLHERRIHAKLERRGARYRGSYTGLFTIECGGTRSTSHVTLELKVAAAKAIGHSWQATRLVGTLSQNEPAELGCAPSEARFAVPARLVR